MDDFFSQPVFSVSKLRGDAYQQPSTKMSGYVHVTMEPECSHCRGRLLGFDGPDLLPPIFLVKMIACMVLNEPSNCDHTFQAWAVHLPGNVEGSPSLSDSVDASRFFRRVLCCSSKLDTVLLPVSSWATRRLGMTIMFLNNLITMNDCTVSGT